MDIERKGEWLELRLPRKVADNPEQTEQYLLEKLGIPDPYLQRMNKRKDIVRSGDRLRLRFFAARPFGFPAEWHPLEVLYEDDFCLVVNKPAGMPVHPSAPGQTGTLANAVAFHYESAGRQIAVRHIHRLDEWTSGPVLYGKNEFAQYKLDEDMREKKIERMYTAIVKGVPLNGSGTINAPIGRDRHRSCRRRVSPHGDPAVTHYETIEIFEQAALLRLRLETGRTHQIRVHLSHIGHPIIGDELYGGSGNRIDRQALHGESLRFRHPLTKEKIEVHAELPEDMQRLILVIRGKEDDSKSSRR